ERLPQCLDLREQALHFGGVCCSRGPGIRIQIFLQACPCFSDILHDQVIGPVLLREGCCCGENRSDKDERNYELSIHFSSFLGPTGDDSNVTSRNGNLSWSCACQDH